MGRYRTVNLLEDDGEDPLLKAKGSLALNNLFEVKGLATIGEDVNNTENAAPAAGDPISRVAMVSNGTWLAVAVHSDVNLFMIKEDFEYQGSHSYEGEEICGMAWMGESHCLAIFTNARQLHLLSPLLGPLYCANIHHERSTCNSASITCVETGEACLVTVADDAGVINTGIFPHWNNVITCLPDEAEHVVKQMIDGACFRNGVSSHAPTDVRASLNVLGLVANSSSSASIMVSDADSVNFQELFSHESARPFVRTREVCNGRFLVAVTDDGEAVVYDMWSFSVFDTKQFNLPAGHRVMDFVFVENPQFDFSFSDIVLVIDIGGKYEIQVKSLAAVSTVFQLPVQQGTILLPAAQSTQRVMLLVEPGHDMVTVKEISESDPETRFNRLIERNLLDEAEQFAKQYGLDCQRVFVSRMEMLYEETCRNPSEEVFNRFIKSMDDVCDHNRVAESCYSGAATFEDYNRVLAMFNYIEKKNVTDKDCLERLSNLAYVFATFRMVVKPEQANFDSWPMFVSGVNGSGDWMELFNSYLEAGYIQEARTLWQRHNEHIAKAVHEEISETQTISIFPLLKQALGCRLEVWRDAISFLESDVILQCLRENSEESTVCHSMVDFLLFLAKNLESLMPREFPDNALHAVSTMDRVAKLLADNAVTPVQQALLAMIGRYFHSPESRIQELSEYTRNLKMIKRLKEVYECPFSYDQFVILDCENICYKILDFAVKNPTQVRQRVTKFARPYMEENHLDCDNTILRYIENVSQQAVGAHSGTWPWHEQCLLVSETIGNYSLKCRAITLIARNAQPPWDRKLNDAVKAIMDNSNTESSMAEELRRVCVRADLGEILGGYSVNFMLLDSIITKESTFSKFLTYIMQSKDRFTDEKRLQDALTAVGLFEKLHEKRSYLTSAEQVYMSYTAYLLKSSGNLKPLATFLDSLAGKGDGFQMKVTRMVVDTLAQTLNSPVQFVGKDIVAGRLRTIACIESLIQRFLHADATAETLYKDVVAIRRMQEKYNKWVTFDNLRDAAWKEDELMAFAAGCEEIAEVYLFANSMNMDRDAACRVILALCMHKNEILAMAQVLREATLTITDPSKELMETFVKCLTHTLDVLPVACDADADADTMQTVVDLMCTLAPVTVIITDFALKYTHLLELSIQICQYMTVFMMMMEQFVMEEEGNLPSDEQPNRNVRDERVCGMSRRVGVYHIGNDGSLMSKLQAIPLMCAVSRSICADPNITAEARGELLNKWDDLCNFLAVENQDILVYTCRIFSTYLPCFICPGESFSISHSLVPHARNICERALQMHPCDLWTTCGILMALPFKLAEQITQELRVWVSRRRSPQTMLNYIRTVQFFVIQHQKIPYYDFLKGTFIKYMWYKRLGKAGISLPSRGKNDSNPMQAIEEFAKHKLDPAIVLEHFSEFWSLSVDEQMLSYVLALVSKASSSTGEDSINSYLQTATIAIKQCGAAPAHVFRRFRAALYTLCPYNYAPIFFLLNHMTTCLAKIQSMDSGVFDLEESGRFVAGCVLIYEFLIVMPRKSSITKAEINWFMNQQKLLQRDKQQYETDTSELKSLSLKEYHGEHVRSCYETGTTTQENQAMEQDLMYERDEVQVSSLPEAARRHLPLHLFLYTDADDILRNLVPLVEAEVDLHNVILWRTLAKHVLWLRNNTRVLPREMWLLNAIVKKVKDCINKGLELSVIDKNAITQLFLHNSSKDDVVQCMAQCARTLALSTVKVQLLELGVSVGMTWMETAEDERERAEYMQQGHRLRNLIVRYKTELLLKKEGLNDALSADLVERPTDLIGFIYSQNVDWDSPKDIERKARLIEKLADLNGADLASLQEELVKSWMPEGEQTSDGFAVDLNDTMGMPPAPMVDDSCSDDADMKLPIFDSSMTRIVHLLRSLKSAAILLKLINMFIRNDLSSVPGGCKTAVRAACAILRTYNNDELEAAKFSDVKFGNFIEYALYTRLLELAKEDIPMDTFMRRGDKSQIAKALMAPTKRHTPQLLHLAACVVIDNDVVDKTTVEALSNKLCQARKQDIFIAFLKYCRKEKALHSIRNIALFWPKAYDTNSVFDLSPEKIYEWLFFLLSCPVDGGRSFEATRGVLLSLGFPTAATLISILAYPTKKTTEAGGPQSPKDLRFRWSSDVYEAMSLADDSMDF